MEHKRMTKLLKSTDKVEKYLNKHFSDRNGIEQNEVGATDIFVSQKPFFESDEYGYIDALDVAVHVTISSVGRLNENVIQSSNVSIAMIRALMLLDTKKGKKIDNTRKFMCSLQNLVDQKIIGILRGNTRVNDVNELNEYELVTIVQPKTKLNGNRKLAFWKINSIEYKKIIENDSLSEVGYLMSAFALVATRIDNSNAYSEKDSIAMWNASNGETTFNVLQQLKNISSYESLVNMSNRIDNVGRKAVTKYLGMLVDMKLLKTVKVHFHESEMYEYKSFYSKYTDQEELAILVLAGFNSSVNSKVDDNIKVFTKIDAIVEDEVDVIESEPVDKNYRAIFSSELKENRPNKVNFIKVLKDKKEKEEVMRRAKLKLVQDA